MGTVVDEGACCTELVKGLRCEIGGGDASRAGKVTFVDHGGAERRVIEDSDSEVAVGVVGRDMKRRRCWQKRT